MSAELRVPARADLASVTTPPRADRPCRLVRWEPWPFQNDHLIGHATIDFSGWQVARIPIFRRKDGSLSCGVPNIPEVDRDGRQREKDGRRVYSSVVSFTTAADRERWDRMVLGALAADGIGGAQEPPP